MYISKRTWQRITRRNKLQKVNWWKNPQIWLAFFTCLLVIVGVTYSIYTYKLFEETRKMRLEYNRPFVFSYPKDIISVDFIEIPNKIAKADTSDMKIFFELIKMKLNIELVWENWSNLPAFNVTTTVVFSKDSLKKELPPTSFSYNFIKPEKCAIDTFTYFYDGSGFDKVQYVHFFTYYQFERQNFYSYIIGRLEFTFPGSIKLEQLYSQEVSFSFVFNKIYQENGRFDQNFEKIRLY